ncbi:hypothetical protein Tco_0808734 [Tanacetum coccineum]
MPVSELRQKGVYEESFSRHAAWIGEKLIQLMHIKMVQEQIVDFLNAHTIKYALTINRTIYTSCIEQFWATAKAKTLNGEVQLQVLVDGKKVIVTESSVRRDLQLEDVEGVDCLPNVSIFEQLALMGKQRQCNIVGPNPRQTLIDTKISIRTSLGSGPRRQETMVDTISQTRSENVSKHSNDLLLAGVNTPQSGEDNEDITLGSTHVDANTDMFWRYISDVVAAKDVNLSVNEVTLAQAVATLKSSKPKDTTTPTKTTVATTVTPASTRPRAKGIVFHNQEQASIPTPIVSSPQPSQDKGKGKMVKEEPVKKFSKKDQLKLDEEFAFKLQAEEEEERLAREKAQKVQEDNIAWDDISAN